MGRAIFMKSKIFRINDVEYQKFYAEMVAMFTEPGLIELEDEDIAPFKDFMGGIYMGESESSGENAAKIATKEAISKADNFASAKEVLLHILGSSDKVDISTASEATSVIYETAPNAECIFGVHVNENMGDTVRVTLVAKIP